MKNLVELPKTALFYGFLVWVIPFVVAILIYPVRSSNRPLFESIMPVVLVTSIVTFAVLYFKKLGNASLKDGVLLGFVWLAISLGLDFLMFIRGPIKMSLEDYVQDIGLSYLIIPIITIGFSYLFEKRNKKISQI